MKAIIASISAAIAVTCIFTEALAAEQPIAASKVPTAVTQFSRSIFTSDGPIMRGTATNACFKGVEFRSLSGWYVTNVPLTDADKLNGLSTQALFTMHARAARITPGSAYFNGKRDATVDTIPWADPATDAGLNFLQADTPISILYKAGPKTPPITKDTHVCP